MFQQMIVLGNVGGDPEVQEVNGVSKATFSVATSKHWKDKEGEKHEKTQWHRVVCWRGLADVAAEWIQKGRQLLVIGEYWSREWEDKDGNKKTTWELVANDFKFAGSKGGNGNSSGSSQVSAPKKTKEPGYQNDDIPF